MENVDKHMDETNVQLAENEDIEEQEELINEYKDKRGLLESTKIVKQTWSILETYQKMKEKKLILDPAYQRNEVWDISKMTAFIESLFMGIIIPPIYVVEIPGDDDPIEGNKYEVVDGKQRLSTMQKFIKNEFPLQEKSLEYYRDWFGGKTYSDILEERKTLTKEMLSSVLDIYVITANSPVFTKYDIFSRLNKGAMPLRANEIRKAVYHSEALKVIDEYVKEINKDEERFNSYKAVFSDKDIERYEDYGRFYRSIAYYYRVNEEDEIVEGYKSRPREMINDVLQSLQNNELKHDVNLINSIINQTIQLILYFKEDVENNMKAKKDQKVNYLVDACIYFAVVYPDKMKEKHVEIKNDTIIQKTFIKSPSTTTNVNDRVKRIKEILNRQE